MRIKLERAGYFLTINSIIFGFQKTDKIQRGKTPKPSIKSRQPAFSEKYPAQKSKIFLRNPVVSLLSHLPASSGFLKQHSNVFLFR